MRKLFFCAVRAEREKAIVVWKLANNFCSSGTATVREPIGKGTHAVGSRYQRSGEDTAD
jgi:hypothetical protein